MTPSLARDLTGALDPDVFVNHFGSTEIYTSTICPDAAAKPGGACRAGRSPESGWSTRNRARRRTPWWSRASRARWR